MTTHPGDQELGPPSANGASAAGGPFAGARGVERLSCFGFVELLDDYLADALPRARSQAIEAHLATCPDCAHYLDAYRKTIELGRSAVIAADEPADVELPPELILTILATLGNS